MSLKTYLSLGRVSNLPTVWSNVLAAGAIASASSPPGGWLSLLVAMSLFYIGGMYDNDVCDAHHDAVNQPYRPIPAGQISRDVVARCATGFFIFGLLLIFLSQHLTKQLQGPPGNLWLSVISTLCLVGFILSYNRHHKNNPYSPMLMAACRVSVLVTTVLTLNQSLSGMLGLAIFSMLCWLIGLTYFAKYEQRISTLNAAWPLCLLLLPIATGLALSLSSAITLLPTCVLLTALYIAYRRLSSGSPKAKGSAIALLIASICLLDGIYLSYYWGIGGAVLSLMAFALTLSLQKYIAGT